MPTRFNPSRRMVRVNDLHVFQFGDGCWSPLPREPVYADRQVAFRQWEACRRAVWEATPRFRIPGAARVYDGLSCDGWQALWGTWRSPEKWSLERILEALSRDREAVEVFRTEDPQAASISDYLDMVLQDFNAVESEARRIDAVIHVELFPGRPKILARHRYGDAPQGEVGM
jgi:hypothetical protein